MCCNNIDQSPFPDMCSRSNMFRIGYFWNCIIYCNRALSCYLYCTKCTCHVCRDLFHFLAQTLSSMHQMDLLKKKKLNLYHILLKDFFHFIQCKTDFLPLPSPLHIHGCAAGNRVALPTEVDQRKTVATFRTNGNSA